MAHIPIFLIGEKQHILIVGSSPAAMAKLALFKDSGARITVVSPAAHDQITAAGLDTMNALIITDRNFQTADLDGKTLVYIDPADEITAERAYQLSTKRGLPTNMIDKPAKSNFTTPALFRRGALSVALSSDGAAPVFVRRLRALLETIVSPALGTLSTAAGFVRSDVKNLVPNAGRRRAFWDYIFSEADRFQTLNSQDAAALLLKEASQFGKKPAGKGLVQLVGAGPGDPDLLTIKAHRALQEADVILFDRLVSDAVLDLARRDSEKLYVGKEKGNHGMGQSGIARLMLTHAQAGKRVVRLKSGDPLLFARVGEELDALRGAGIDVEIIPGITAVAACAARAQIPLTDRDYSASLTMVTGQRKDGGYDDYARLAGKGATLAVYMGLGSSEKLAAGLISKGVPAETPVAVIENGARENERRLYGTLETLDALILRHEIVSPALILIGDVVQKSADWPAHKAQETLDTLPRLAIAAW